MSFISQSQCGGAAARMSVLVQVWMARSRSPSLLRENYHDGVHLPYTTYTVSFLIYSAITGSIHHEFHLEGFLGTLAIRCLHRA